MCHLCGPYYVTYISICNFKFVWVRYFELFLQLSYSLLYMYISLRRNCTWTFLRPEGLVEYEGIKISNALMVYNVSYFMKSPYESSDMCSGGIV